MNFPQFWARGRSADFLAWRWSFKSLAEAQALADQAAQQLADRFRAGLPPPKHGGYYPDRPFREQVLQEFKDHAGKTSGIITRNSYGCQVLNTARVMFVDIDLPEPKRSGGFLSRLFGKAPPASPLVTQAQALERIGNWTRNNSEWGWRIYRTRSGLRLLATQDLVEPGGDGVEDVFAALGADPLYQRLCTTQKCFRARLTPKPWRCGVYSKPARWPWLDPKQEIRFQKWQAHYAKCSASWATCELIQQIGNPTIHPEVRPIIQLHDNHTRVESKLLLA